MQADTPKLKIITPAPGVDAPATYEIAGEICYPAEGVPAMNVYVREVESSKAYKTTTAEGATTFRIAGLPPGGYIAFAYTVEKLATDPSGNANSEGGAYTQAVPCGLSVKCEDHSLILFKVGPGEKKEIVRICDWYGAEIPPYDLPE